jgi:hypothetical protein
MKCLPFGHEVIREILFDHEMFSFVASGEITYPWGRRPSHEMIAAVSYE